MMLPLLFLNLPHFSKVEKGDKEQGRSRSRRRRRRRRRGRRRSRSKRRREEVGNLDLG